jgi:GNAT superfamily N-acetyltransferase
VERGAGRLLHVRIRPFNASDTVAVVDRRIGEIDMLAVDPPHQGAGIGTALTTFALDWIRASGIAVAMVGTGADPGHRGNLGMTAAVD